MKAEFILAICLLVFVNHAYSQEEIKLWPTGLPDGSVQLPDDRVRELQSQEKVHPRGHRLYVDQPSLHVYRPPQEKANGCAVIICPGGGYNVLAWQHEGVDVAQWFNSFGVTAFVLKYRVPRRIPDKIHWEPMQDVQRSIRLLRHQCEHYQIDPQRIGVLGFSAGGHLTVMAGVQFDTRCYAQVDEADKLSARPNFICPIYAAYLANGYKDNIAELGDLVTVTDKTPPTFMAVTWDDRFRGAQAALLFADLKLNNVPAELHVYGSGGHGYGIRKSTRPVSSWNLQLWHWMKDLGLLEKVDPAGKHLFILSGQSNMVGLRPNESFKPMVDREFGKQNVIVVKDAHSGQPIQRWYKNWKNSAGNQPEKVGDLYDGLIAKVRQAVSGQQLASVTFVWMQGERDARKAWGGVYKDSLAGLLDQVKRDLELQDLRFVIGRLSDFDLTNEKYPHWTMVREAQMELAEESRFGAWIDTDDLNDGRNRQGKEIRNDLHYSAQGYISLGRRMAKKAIALIKD